MIIGFIGFGKVSQNLLKLIDCEDIDFITSAEERSEKTLESIKNSGIEVSDTFMEVASKSDILISANSPGAALSTAEKYGRYCRGIYFDLNNVSPDTISEIDRCVENLVDGAIIGKIDSENPLLFMSGPKADSLMFLNEFITSKKISDKTGDASLLKMLRSSYTKTLSALLIESYEIAERNNLSEEFFEVLEVTEGRGFRQKSMSRIQNTLSSSKRKSEELNEIVNYFNDDDLIMVKAALEKLMQYQH